MPPTSNSEFNWNGTSNGKCSDLPAALPKYNCLSVTRDHVEDGEFREAMVNYKGTRPACWRVCRVWAGRIAPRPGPSAWF
jgi:hypothetical protein